MATTASGGDGLLDGHAVRRGGDLPLAQPGHGTDGDAAEHHERDVRLAPAAIQQQAAAIGPVMAPVWNAAELPRCSDPERELYADLVCDRLGVKVRLEQERIDWGWALERLST